MRTDIEMGAMVGSQVTHSAVSWNHKAVSGSETAIPRRLAHLQSVILLLFQYHVHHRQVLAFVKGIASLALRAPLDEAARLAHFALALEKRNVGNKSSTNVTIVESGPETSKTGPKQNFSN